LITYVSGVRWWFHRNSRTNFVFKKQKYWLQIHSKNCFIKENGCI